MQPLLVVSKARVSSISFGDIIVPIRVEGLGFKGPIMENQMEKKMENEMETGMI